MLATAADGRRAGRVGCHDPHPRSRDAWLPVAPWRCWPVRTRREDDRAQIDLIWAASIVTELQPTSAKSSLAGTRAACRWWPSPREDVCWAGAENSGVACEALVHEKCMEGSLGVDGGCMRPAMPVVRLSIRVRGKIWLGVPALPFPVW